MTPDMRMKIHERASGMIEGVGRLQAVAPAASEARQAESEMRASGPAEGASARPGVVAEVAARVADLSMGRLAADMAAAAPVDMARVAALREAIADGSYRADPDAIASAMLRYTGDGV